MNKIVVEKNTLVDTIQKAIDLIDINQDNEIFVKQGIYFEKLKIKFYSKHSLKIIGESKENTIISFNDFARKIHLDGLEYNTFRTSTLMLLGNNISLENLTVENTCGCGKKFGQGVALYITGHNVYVNNCILKAHQDTLFLGPLPKDLIERYQNFLQPDELIYPIDHTVYINNSYIEGDVDFIFGGAVAYFKECEIHSLERDGFVFAPSTEKEEQVGFIVENCRFTSSNNNPHVYLARPWRDYGMVEIKNSLMDNHIYDLGFDKWNDTSRDLTCRFYESASKYFDNHKYNRCYFVNKNINK